jgi:ABC-type multidrug transport system ATPase subunit
VVRGFPEGIDTLVGAGFGGQFDLSGGQWQRLALARLMYQDAPVMILDEPVASLDPEGERAVFQLFSQVTEGKVIIFTTHRYDSIPRNTKIVVLVDGRITEVGTHDELLQRERDYWALYMSSNPTGRSSPEPKATAGKVAAVARQMQSAIADAQPHQRKSPYWLITRMSELDQHDLEVMEAIRRSGVKVTSFATKHISAELVRE